MSCPESYLTEVREAGMYGTTTKDYYRFDLCDHRNKLI